MFRQFGFPPQQILDFVKSSADRADTIYAAALDEPALWDPSTLDDIVRDFPQNLMPEGDLFLILSECLANAALHGRAQAIGLVARQRKNLMLLSFLQSPPMMGRVAVALSIAKNSLVDHKSCDLDSGLGFPILLRLSHDATISIDYTRLQLWFRLKAE